MAMGCSTLQLLGILVFYFAIWSDGLTYAGKIGSKQSVVPNTAFRIKHKSSGKFIRSDHTGYEPPLTISHYGDYFRFEMVVPEMNMGFIHHEQSGKIVHPLGGSFKPESDTMLVLHNDRGSQALFSLDQTSHHIQHVGGLYIHPKGGNPDPAYGTNLILQHDIHSHMEFEFDLHYLMNSSGMKGATSGANQFQCNTGGGNITSQLLCDGHADCEDGSDEADCHPKGKSSWVPCDVCFEDQFQCYSSGKCIPQLWTCDNIYDCDDNSDENCNWYGNDYKLREPVDGKSSPSSKHSECWVPATYCPPNHYRCYYSGKCIPAFWQCDGYVDCEDYSDEDTCFLRNAHVGTKRKH